MENAERFTPLTVDSADPRVAPVLRASLQQFGFVPSPVARAAHSPAYLKHLMAGFAAFEQSSLSELEREVIALTVAFEIECHYCMALHSALLSRTPEHGAVLEALRAGMPLESRRLEVLREFTRAVVAERGRVPSALFHELERQGFTRQAALDALLGIGVYLLSTLGNVLTEAPLDPAFAAFEWHKPRRSVAAQ